MFFCRPEGDLIEMGSEEKQGINLESLDLSSRIKFRDSSRRSHGVQKYSYAAGSAKSESAGLTKLKSSCCKRKFGGTVQEYVGKDNFVGEILYDEALLSSEVSGTRKEGCRLLFSLWGQHMAWRSGKEMLEEKEKRGCFILLPDSTQSCLTWYPHLTLLNQLMAILISNSLGTSG